MRSRPLFWMVVSLVSLAGAFYCWRLGEEWAGRGPGAAITSGGPAAGAVSSSATSRIQRQSSAPTASRVVSGSSAPGFLTGATASIGPIGPISPTISPTNRHAGRLSNTTKTVQELLRDGRGIILENALLDTRRAVAFSIPEQLKMSVAPGSYVVQARGLVDEKFRAALRGAGAEIVSPIPNNAFLVRVSAAGAGQLKNNSGTVGAVLGWEPSYKLLSGLLPLAVAGKALPEGTRLNVVLFGDARGATVTELERLGAVVLGEGRTPFGPVLTVAPPADWVGVARLPGVQLVERFYERVGANDLSRARTGVAVDAIAPENYFNLTGSNVLVNVNDTGVDAAHPDFVGRVLGDYPASLTDTNGHGTHVAGIIAGDGASSLTVSNAQGSVMPAVAGQFRGKAPGARIFAMRTGLGGPFSGDAYYQEAAARTNVLISNNSWHFGSDNTYGIGAANYDWAVRDALPEVTGMQPLLYVFAAGNGGGGNDSGLSGNPESVLSPGTAKNVITVGMVEQARDITNEVWKCTGVGTNVTSCTTNEPWRGMTSSGNQVAAASGRGNVGIGTEGDFGRLKPDVVAPGTFVISTRSTTWDEAAYYNPTNHHVNSFLDQVVPAGGQNNYSLFVPQNAVAVTVTVVAGVDLPLYLEATTIPTTNDYVRDNQLFIPSDLALAAVLGSSFYYSVGNTTTQDVEFAVFTDIITTNDNGNYFEVLSNLNNTLGDNYRYESGTSMAAAEVSGVLALMQEFFQERGLTNSPALYKALLINGARSAGSLYDFQVRNPINFQGWGLINLPNSLPNSDSNVLNGVTHAGASSIQLFDQSPTNALATGQSQTRTFTVTEDARTLPLRVTLVWTDPPGNPAAGVKLVNNLDLVVTNLETGDVYFGNDIGVGSNFTFPWATNSVPNQDFVNNVENVYLAPALGSNYAVTVVGRHVNVNAVTGHSNDVAQDYALVISSGNGELPDALTVTEAALVSTNQLTLTALTNGFGNNPDLAGGLLLGQRVGANTPLLGTTNGLLPQWHFYVITNTTTFTNAAFVTFLPPTLSIPRLGVREGDLDNATRIEADIDLYVSLNPALTNLDPVVLAAADQSRTRGGTELIVYSNALPEQVYYIGVKSEDSMAAEYAFLGVFSLYPFSEREDGNLIVRGLPVPVAIPDGSPAQPGAALILGLAIEPVPVRRVVVTNSFFHENPGDLLGNLSHGQNFAVLNNHRGGLPGGYTFVYEDNGEQNLQHTDGPGSLRSFVGEPGFGVWILAMVDNALTQTGAVQQVNGYAGLTLRLEPQNLDGTGALRGVAPNTFTYDFIEVPVAATNLTVCVSGNTGPMELYIRRDEFPTRTDYDYTLTVPIGGGCLSIDKSDLPPLTAGRYFIGVYNSSGVLQNIRIIATLGLDPAAIVPVTYTSGGNEPLKDDAVTYSTIFVNDDARVASVEVGVRLNHPRVSDLALTLVSPNGTRILLMENRGGTNSSSAGTSQLATNVTTVETTFETAFPGTYTPGFGIIENWTVTNSAVQVLQNNAINPPAHTGSKYLALRSGGIARTFPTKPGANYTLTYATRRVPTLEGIISWWPAEGTGTDVIGGHNATVPGGVAYVPAVVNQGFGVNQASGRITVADTPELNFGPNKDFSIEGWIQAFPTPYQIQTIVDKRVAPDLSHAIGYEFNLDNGRVHCRLSDSPADVGTGYGPAGPDLRDGLFHHVGLTIVRNSTTGGKLYVDGVVVLTFDPTGEPGDYSNTGELRIGNHPTTGLPDYFNGTMDEIAIYKRSLSTSEIQSIVAAGAAGKCGLTVPPTNCLPFAGQVVVGGITNAISALSTNWVINSVNFVGTQTNTLVQFGSAGGNSGLLLDTLTLTETLVLTQSFHLTFTENTNLTTTPIKFAAPPFATGNAPSNYFISGFEPAAAGDYLSPAVVDGWSVLTSQVNQVSIINDASLTVAGSKLLALAKGKISRILPTTSGRSYTLSHAYRGPGIVSWWRGENDAVDAISGNNGTLGRGATFANALVGRGFSLDGANDYVFVPDSASLKLTNSLTMEAWVFITNRPVLPGMIFFRGDNRSGLDPYVLTTETSGMFGFGICNAANVSTGMGVPLITNQFVHIVGTLENASGLMRMYTNGVLAGELTTAIRPLGDLTGSQPGLGIGNHSGNPPSVFNYPLRGRVDEASLYNRALTSSEIRAIHAAGSAGKFNPLLAAPQNLAEAQVTLGNLSPQIILGENMSWKTNTIVFTATQTGTPLQIEGLQPGVLLDTFTLNEAGGAAYYLPEESLKALADENAYGQWRLEIWDSRTGMTNLVSLVDWQLSFVYQTDIPYPGVLVHGVAQTNSLPPGQIAYYIVDVPAWAQYATNTLLFATAPGVNLIFNQNTQPTGTNAGDYFLLVGSTGGIGNPVLSTNTTPPLVPGARYYLGVQNPGATPLNYALRVDFDITPLFNTVPVSGTLAVGPLPRYFSYDVTTNATAVSFQLTNLNGNVDLVARRNAPLPTPNSFDYGSFNAGNTDDEIFVFTNSTPVALSAGRWYLGVFNQDAVPVNYTIVAAEYTNLFPVITLENGISYPNTNNAVIPAADYYRYVVTGVVARAQFEINGPSGDMTLVARKGLPLPSLTLPLFDYLSANTNLNDELIVVFTNSTPVALSGGSWYLTAVNVSGGPVTYAIKATQWPVTGRPLIVIDGSVVSNRFCLTWTSLPGVHYYVEGLTDLSSTNWVTISPTITATDYTTTWCIALPSEFHFFRVVEGLALTAYVPPLVITSITRTNNAVVLAWSGPTNLQYQVQWTPTVAPELWNTFTNVLTSPTGQFIFVDDGTQTGGLGPTRFYRLLQL